MLVNAFMVRLRCADSSSRAGIAGVSSFQNEGPSAMENEMGDWKNSKAERRAEYAAGSSSLYTRLASECLAQPPPNGEKGR